MTSQKRPACRPLLVQSDIPSGFLPERGDYSLFMVFSPAPATSGFLRETDGVDPEEKIPASGFIPWN